MNKIRNIGIIAHINAGKTTTTERILYHAGLTRIVGDVDKGNTVTDYLIQERTRGITITSAAVSFDWKGHRVNLIDTPGHIDFTVEVERSISVLDGAVTILDSSAGVEAQTITVWRQARKYNVPNIIYLNKYDKHRANISNCMIDLRAMLGVKPCLLQLPIKERDGKFSILDIIRRTHLTWRHPEHDFGAKFESHKVNKSDSCNHFEKIEEERERLINTLTDVNDAFANHVISCNKISDVDDEELTKAVRKATLDLEISPVLLGSSFKYIGVQQLMDAVVNYLPSPKERKSQIISLMSNDNRRITEKQNDCAFIFKVCHDKRLGQLNFVRVYSGSVKKQQKLKNLRTRNSEQIKKLYRVFADEMREIDEPVEEDDIVAISGLSNSKTGDILVAKDPNTDPTEHDIRNFDTPFIWLDKSILVPQIKTLEPVYYCTIESSRASEQLQLEDALERLSREDPSFSFEVDQHGVTTVRGMGKLHLEVSRDRIETEYKIRSLLGPLQISYRETVQNSASEELQVSKLINGITSKMSVRIHLGPKPKAGPWTHKSLKLDTMGENSLNRLRNDHRKAIEAGILSALNHGPTLGFPIIDCEVTLLDFTANGRCSLPVISSGVSECLTNAVARCNPIVLEPVMLLEVSTPREFNGIILADLALRRAIVTDNCGFSDGTLIIKAEAPLSSLTDYSEVLRVQSSGRASFTIRLKGYVPRA